MSSELALSNRSNGSRQQQPIELDRNNPECTEFLDAVNFLIYLREPSKLINNCTSETLNCLNRINAFNYKHSSASFDLLGLDVQKRFVQMLNDFFQYIYEYLKENAATYYSAAKSLEPRRFDILYKFALILWTWADRSVEFCLRLHDFHFIRVIFKYLSDETLISRLKSNPTDPIHVQIMRSMKSTIGCLHNLSKYEHRYTSEWAGTNCVNVLLSLVESFRTTSSATTTSEIRLLVYFTILNLSNARDFMDRLNEIDTVVVDVVDLISRCSSKISLDENLERRFYKIETEDSSGGTIIRPALISVVASRDSIWRLTELFSFLIKLIDITHTNDSTVNNSQLRYDLYERRALKTYLARILFNGNAVEKEYALKLLWKLSLDKRVSKSIRADLSMYSFLVGLSMNQYNRDRALIKYSNCILFGLNYAASDHLGVPNATTSVSYNDTSATTYFADGINVSSLSSSTASRASSFSRIFICEEVEFLKI